MSLPLAGHAARPAGRPARVGVLSYLAPDQLRESVGIVRRGLRELGHVEGRDFTRGVTALAAEPAGKQVELITAEDCDASFRVMADERAEGLILFADGVFGGQRVRLVEIVSRLRRPAVCLRRLRAGGRV